VVEDSLSVAIVEVDPVIANEVGPTVITYTASPGAVAADLLDDGVQIATGPVSGSFIFPVTSAPKNNPGSWLTVRVRDAEDQSAEDKEYQRSKVKEQGSQVWTTVDGDGVFSTASAVALQDGHAVAAGFRVVNGVVLGTLRRYDKVGEWTTDEGWSLSHTEWTKFDDLKTGGLSASGVAVDAELAIVLVGTSLIGGEQRMYVARFDPDGVLDWEARGEPGSGARGVGVLPDGTIYIAGSQRTSNNPDNFDMRTWVFDSDSTPYGFDSYKDPSDIPNARDEFGRAVAVLANGDVVVAGMGERVGNDNEVLLRGLVVLYEGKGKRVSEWVSPGDKLAQDAILAAVSTGDGFATCGYSQNDPSDLDQRHQILVRWHGEDLAEVAAPRLEITKNGGECTALGYNLEDATIIGATVAVDGQGDDSWIVAFHDAISPLTVYMKRNGLANGADRILGLSCDYMCAWAGAEEVDTMQWIVGMIRG
jgi:hypothetical protein